MDTEGARQLAALPGTVRELAAVIGCSPQTIANWRTGAKVPDERSRQRIARVWGIPATAWVIAPHTSSSAPPSIAPPRGAAPTTLEGCLELLAVLREDRGRKNLLPSERVKLADSEARLLALRHRLEAAAELTDDRIVREHPLWHRIRKVIARVLAKHPVAAREVAAALEEIDRSPSVNDTTTPVQ